MFRLAHLSDVHLGPLPPVRYRELVSKRITGYVNWHRNRSRNLGDDVLSRLCDDMLAQEPDHIALTGDLVNLALDAEIEAARLWLQAFAPAGQASVVPGNHDAYVPGALEKACHAWSPWMTGDGVNAPVTRKSFPYLRVRGPVALIGVSSAVATAPFLASGEFSGKQARKLAPILEEAGERGLYRVIMIHHPPLRGAASPYKRLYGIRRFQKTVLEHGAELVLHGHTHLPTLGHIRSDGRVIPVAGVPAGGQGLNGHKPAAGYSLFEIDGGPGAWTTTMRRRALTGQTLGFKDVEHRNLDE